MLNTQNLVPFSHRTENEQREITKKGGIASGKSRNKVKRFRDAVEKALVKKVQTPKK